MRPFGFNFQWIFWQNSPEQKPKLPELHALDFIARRGFDTVRIPASYRFWTPTWDYASTSEEGLSYLDGYLEACRARDLHLCLNLHRVPGYCINGADLERHNLWRDREAQDGLVTQWETLARRYQGVESDRLSFDLINEPPSLSVPGFDRDIHEKIIRRVVAAIRSIDAHRRIIVDGIGAGHLAIPELADLGVEHSTRGYMPMPVSHHEASWWDDEARHLRPEYPGLDWEGRRWDRSALETFYEPWRSVERQGVSVHVGEMGCYERTPQDVALRWLKDLFGLFQHYGWGYLLWEFEGPFGVVGHRRPGARFEELDGFLVDRALLDLMEGHRDPAG